MRSKPLAVLALLAVIFSLVISLYHLAYVQKIYPHISLGPIKVSNLNLKAAEQKIQDNLPPDLREISLVFGSLSWPVDLNKLEINYDASSSAQSAYVLGRSDNFFKDLKLKWRLWRKPQTLPLVFSLNETKFDQVINEAVLAINEEPIQPALLLNQENEVGLIPGKNGRVVSQELLSQELSRRIATLDWSPLEIPIKLVTVDADVDQLAKGQALANELKSKQLVLTYEDFYQKIDGQALLDLISLSGGWDEGKIASLTAQLAKNLDRPSQNAAFRFDGARVVEFKPALAGLTLDQPTTTQLIKDGLQQMAVSAESQKINLAVNATPPANGLGDVNNLGIKELLGKGESTFKGSIPGRKHNIALAASRVSGLLVPPGATFSFNQMVGDVSRENGYQSAYIIKDGRTVLGDGGGVCQVSTTLFRAALNAGLEIVERKAHSYRVGYYEQNSPAGLDATVFAPSVDFKFKNDTNSHLLIQATVDTNNSYLKFELYGAGDSRKAAISNTRLWGQTPPPPDLYVDDPTLAAGQIKQIDWKAWGGKAAFDWTVVRNGETIREQTFYSGYQPWQAVYLRGTGGR